MIKYPIIKKPDIIGSFGTGKISYSIQFPELSAKFQY